MAITVDLDVMLARRKMSVGDFAKAVGITPANVAVLKNGRARAIRFSTLDAMCRVLDSSRATSSGGPPTRRTDGNPFEAEATQPGSSRRMVVARSMPRSYEAMTPIPVRSALATR